MEIPYMARIFERVGKIEIIKRGGVGGTWNSEREREKEEVIIDTRACQDSN